MWLLGLLTTSITAIVVSFRGLPLDPSPSEPIDPPSADQDHNGDGVPPPEPRPAHRCTPYVAGRSSGAPGYRTRRPGQRRV